MPSKPNNINIVIAYGAHPEYPPDRIQITLDEALLAVKRNESDKRYARNADGYSWSMRVENQEGQAVVNQIHFEMLDGDHIPHADLDSWGGKSDSTEG